MFFCSPSLVTLHLNAFPERARSLPATNTSIQLASVSRGTPENQNGLHIIVWFFYSANKPVLFACDIVKPTNWFRHGSRQFSFSLTRTEHSKGFRLFFCTVPNVYALDENGSFSRNEIAYKIILYATSYIHCLTHRFFQSYLQYNFVFYLITLTVFNT